MLEEIKYLKSQLVAKEKERVDTVDTLHAIKARCISMEAKLETKTEEYDNLRKDFEKIEREKQYLEKKAAKKIRAFMTSALICGNFVRIVMISLVRGQSIPVWSLGSLTHSLDGCVANMKTYLWLFRQVQI